MSGLVVDCPGKGSGKAEVTVADGAGNTATTTVKVVKAPNVNIARLSVPKKVKAGRSAKVKVGVDSTGGAVAVGTKVCLSVKGKASVHPTCQKLGDLKPDKSRAAKVKLKIKNKAKGKLKIKAKVTSKSAANVSATVKTKVKSRRAEAGLAPATLNCLFHPPTERCLRFPASAFDSQPTQAPGGVPGSSIRR